MQCLPLPLPFGFEHKCANQPGDQQDDANDQRDQAEDLMMPLMDEILVHTAKQGDQSDHSNQGGNSFRQKKRTFSASCILALPFRFCPVLARHHIFGHKEARRFWIRHRFVTDQHTELCSAEVIRPSRHERLLWSAKVDACLEQDSASVGDFDDGDGQALHPELTCFKGCQNRRFNQEFSHGGRILLLLHPFSHEKHRCVKEASRQTGAAGRHDHGQAGQCVCDAPEGPSRCGESLVAPRFCQDEERTIASAVRGIAGSTVDPSFFVRVYQPS